MGGDHYKSTNAHVMPMMGYSKNYALNKERAIQTKFANPCGGAAKKKRVVVSFVPSLSTTPSAIYFGAYPG